jgi:hypothetical protein
MTIEDALNIVDSILRNKSLNNIQEAIFRQTWEGKTYSEIAEKVGYDAAYVRDVGYKLWQLLSEAFGDRVTKNNLQVVLRRYSHRSLPTAKALQAVTFTPSPANMAVATDSFTQEIGNGASKLLNLLSRVLIEPNSDRQPNQYWQQVEESLLESSLKLTITVNLSKA